MPYRLIKQEGAARRGEFTTVHGTVQTPAFQNVATAAAIKGGLSALDLKDIRAQAPYYGGGRDLQLPPRRPPYLYGTGAEHADSGKPWLYDCHGL